MSNGDLSTLNFTLGNLVGTVAQIVKKQDEQDDKLDLLLGFRNRVLGYAAGAGAVSAFVVSLLVRYFI